MTISCNSTRSLYLFFAAYRGRSHRVKIQLRMTCGIGIAQFCFSFSSSSLVTNRQWSICSLPSVNTHWVQATSIWLKFRLYPTRAPEYCTHMSVYLIYCNMRVWKSHRVNANTRVWVSEWASGQQSEIEMKSVRRSFDERTWRKVSYKCVKCSIFIVWARSIRCTTYE